MTPEQNHTKNRAWAIKLGSGGACIPFCERHSIVGLGWGGMDRKVLDNGSVEEIWTHINEIFKGQTPKKTSSDTGQIFRFWRECTVGDYVLYYDPPKKCVRICKVISQAEQRSLDFDPNDKSDIWMYRKIEYPCSPIPILDFYGGLKGSLLGPRMSFWSLDYNMVHQIAQGQNPSDIGASDLEIQNTYRELRDLIKKRCESLNDSDWEMLVADYFRHQGASVNERHVGGNQPVIDLEASFSMGEFRQSEVWRVQIKRYQNRAVDWSEIEYYYRRSNASNFCFVSAFGFTSEAELKSEEFEIRLLQTEDFTNFLLSGHFRQDLKRKLNLPL